MINNLIEVLTQPTHLFNFGVLGLIFAGCIFNKEFRSIFITTEERENENE